MYYEDENNLYHYSYRKGDKVEPIYTKNLAEDAAEPAETPKRRGTLKLIALMLVCALIGGVIGAGAMRVTSAAVSGGSGAANSTVNVSDRQTTEVQNVRVGTRELTLPEVYAANIDSVVSINTSITQNVFGRITENAASGSGFIITDDGYIVTNYHVIEDASNVKVTLYNGETYDAEIIGGDAQFDVAVLKIEAGGLQHVTIGDSDNLRIGETVAAIGNPLGELTFSMSAGIVSCVDRAINIDGTPFNMIQVDASINPGNSGGPLVNTYGEVVGIVSAKYSAYSNTTVEGLGFAIPINDVIAMVEDIMENGRVTNRPYLAITGSTLTEGIAQQYRLGVTQGVYVNSVEAGGAAEKAGFRAGDVILMIDGKEIKSLDDLTSVKKSYKAGDTAEFTVYRDGQTITLSLTFDAVPETTETTQQPQQQTPNDNYYNNNDGYNYYWGNGNGGYSNPYDFFNDFFRGFGYNYGGGNG